MNVKTYIETCRKGLKIRNHDEIFTTPEIFMAISIIHVFLIALTFAVHFLEYEPLTWKYIRLLILLSAIAFSGTLPAYFKGRGIK